MNEEKSIINHILKTSSSSTPSLLLLTIIEMEVAGLVEEVESLVVVEERKRPQPQRALAGVDFLQKKGLEEEGVRGGGGGGGER